MLVNYNRKMKKPNDFVIKKNVHS